MIPEPPTEFDRRVLTSYADAEKLVLAFEAALKRHQIRIEHGSPLGAVCLNVMELHERYRGTIPLNPHEDIRPMYSRVLGLIDIIKRVVRLVDHPDFVRLIPHLRLMNIGSVPQNVKAIGDDASNKLFELLMALINLEVGEGVEIDHPKSSKGKNPDVLSIFDGTRWGFPCKVLNGQTFSPITMFDNIEKAVAQIESSPAQIGIVVLNFKNMIDHNELWPITNPEEVKAGQEPKFAAWKHRDIPTGILVACAEEWHAQFEKVNTMPEIQKLFAGKKATPATFAFLQTATAVGSSRGPVPTTLGVFVLMDFLHQNLLNTRPEYRGVLEKLNNAMHHR